jgi:glyoxylase-like metal-dependent hydrolase (beta-lactamase superfamily II)
MEQVAPGLWRWTAYHEKWKKNVGCLILEAGAQLILIDPLVENWQALEALARDREVHVFLTVFWHARTTGEIVERSGARLWSTAAARRRIANRAGAPTEHFEPGDPLPGGLEAFPTGRFAEVVFWLPEQNALAIGDVVMGSPFRLCPQSWLEQGETHESLKAALRPLLDLPVERVLVSHGEPVLAGGHAALADLLAPASPA